MSPNRLLQTLILVAVAFSQAFGQHRPTPEFLQSIGFVNEDGETWKNADGATVTMNGDNVAAFSAPRNTAGS